MSEKEEESTEEKAKEEEPVETQSSGGCTSVEDSEL